MQKKTTKMKELPVSERPYEKCLAHGPAYLSDAELLAVILRCGSQGQNSLDLAIQLVMHYQKSGGIAGICHASVNDLMSVRGVGRVKAVMLQCIGELARRIVHSEVKETLRLTDPASVASYFMEDMRHLEQEEVIAAFFNTKGRMIGSKVISRGTVNASLVTPREVFAEALREKAVYLILLHNHPSGDPEPSREDYLLTDRMAEAGTLMHIPLYDHIIIGNRCYISLLERGYLGRKRNRRLRYGLNISCSCWRQSAFC